MDEYAISGWLALDQTTAGRQQSWGATISSIPDPDGQGWALSLGRYALTAPGRAAACMHGLF